MSASYGPTPEAATLIRSSPAAGVGRGTSSTTTTSGAPKRWIRAALMFAPLIVQEIDPSRSLGLLRVRRAPMDGRAAQKSDEFALSHANVLVEDEAYHKVQRCASPQKLSAEGRDGSNASIELSSHVGFTSDFGRMPATQRTDALGQKPTCALPWRHLRRVPRAHSVARHIRNAGEFAQGCALSVFGIGDFSCLYDHYCGENTTDNDVRCA